MDKKMLQRQITRYTNDAARFKAKADRAYAAYKETNSKNDYLNSQKNYAAAQKAQEVADNYKRMLGKAG